MGDNRISETVLREALNAYEQHKGNVSAAAKSLSINRDTFRGRLARAKMLGITPGKLNFEDVDLLRRQNSRLEGEVKSLVTRLGKHDDTLSIIKGVIHDCDEPARPPKWLSGKTTGKNTGVPTLFLSDIHYDEVVKADQINHVNAFDRAIANVRLKRLFTKTVDLLIHHMAKPQYDYFVLNLGGDCLSGLIHEELRETNEAPISQSILALMDQLIAGIDFLLPYFPKMIINGVVGNHGRWDRKPRMKNRVYENYEWLLYQFLAKHYRDNKDVVFNIADGADCPYAIYKTKFVLTHGDQAKGGSGIAGALSPLMILDARKRKRAMATDQPFDYIVSGHWHQLWMAKGIIQNGCFPAGTPVTMQNGTTKPIDTILIGEKVVTRQGRVRAVVDTLRRDDATKLVVVRCGTKASELRLTPNHRVWAIKNSTIGHLVSINGRTDATEHAPVARWIPAEDLSPSDYVEVPCDRTVVATDEFSSEFCRLMGFYLSEGSISGANGKRHHVDFSLHRNEEVYANFIYDACVTAFGSAHHFLSTKRLTSRSVVVNSSAACETLFALCGKGAGEKCLREDLMTLDPKYQIEILTGWLLGDGHTTRFGREHGDKRSIVVSGSSISRKLIEQMRVIALRCGFFSSVNCIQTGTSPIRRRKHDAYSLVFSGDTARRLAVLLEEYRPSIHDPVRSELGSKGRGRGGEWKSLSFRGSIFAKVTDVWIQSWTDPVYNLTVEEDHSYIANGVGVANSVKGYDEYSAQSNYDFEVPQQWMYVTHPDWGITARWPIILEKPGTRF